MRMVKVSEISKQDEKLVHIFNNIFLRYSQLLYDRENSPGDFIKLSEEEKEEAHKKYINKDFWTGKALNYLERDINREYQKILNNSIPTECIYINDEKGNDLFDLSDLLRKKAEYPNTLNPADIFYDQNIDIPLKDFLIGYETHRSILSYVNKLELRIKIFEDYKERIKNMKDDDLFVATGLIVINSMSSDNLKNSIIPIGVCKDVKYILTNAIGSLARDKELFLSKINPIELLTLVSEGFINVWYDIQRLLLYEPSAKIINNIKNNRFIKKKIRYGINNRVLMIRQYSISLTDITDEINLEDIENYKMSVKYIDGFYKTLKNGDKKYVKGYWRKI